LTLAQPRREVQDVAFRISGESMARRDAHFWRPLRELLHRCLDGVAHQRANGDPRRRRHAKGVGRPLRGDRFEGNKDVAVVSFEGAGKGSGEHLLSVLAEILHVLLGASRAGGHLGRLGCISSATDDGDRRRNTQGSGSDKM
jgi:hypothetical protein